MKNKYLLLIFFTLLGWGNYVHATVKYVNINATGTNNGTSWANAFTSLQSGIGAAITGDTIWVANGTYKPTAVASPTITDRQISFQISNGVVLLGGFNGTETLVSQRNFSAYATILSGDIGAIGNANDNSLCVVKISGSGNLTRLDGFKIINGNANNPGDEKGGGLRNLSGTPTVENCFFSDNHADSSGGALSNEDANLNLLNCTFQSNHSSGKAGAVSINSGTVTIIGCTFFQNQAQFGGALYMFDGVTTLDRCTLSGNTATNTGGVVGDGDNSIFYFYNSLIVGNTAFKGAVYNVSPANIKTHKWINCTIASNKDLSTDPQDYAIRYSYTSDIANCIIVGNITGSGFQIHQSFLAGNIENNLIIPSGGGVGNNYFFLPMFVNPGSAAAAPFNASGYDYRLSAYSQALDTGIAGPPYLSPVYNKDLDGNTRIFGYRVDIGCYEKQYCSFTTTVTPVGGSLDFCVGQTITLVATGTSFRWNIGDSTAAITVGSVLPVNNSTGYTVVALDNAGCRSKVTVTARARIPNVIVSGNTQFCPNGGSTTLTAAGNSVSYLWNTGATTTAITINTAGIYTVTGTDNFGCTRSQSRTISEQVVPQPIIINTATSGLECNNIYYTYQWYRNGNMIPGATARNYTPLQDGTYTVVITTSIGCTSTSAPYNVTGLGINNIGNDQLSIYPNPAENHVIINTNLVDAFIQLRVTDISGKLIFDKEIGKKQFPYGLSVAGIANGVYILELYSKDSVIRKKLTIQH